MLGVEGEGNDEFVERQGGLRVWRRGKVMGFWSGVEGAVGGRFDRCGSGELAGLVVQRKGFDFFLWALLESLGSFTEDII